MRNAAQPTTDTAAELLAARTRTKLKELRDGLRSIISQYAMRRYLIGEFSFDLVHLHRHVARLLLIQEMQAALDKRI